MAKDTLWQFLSVAHNPDGSLKSAQAENLTEWVDSALTATYVSATEFSVGGDQTDIFVQNRKIKATLDASVVYSAIDTSNYDDTGDETTVTLVDAVLDDTLQAIEYGLVKPGDSGSLPRLIASVIDFDDSNVSFFASEIQTAIENLNLATTPTGSVFHFAASSPPPGYLECNGAEISRTTYADLYSVIGTTFGEGDGSTTFNIPDLRGEFIRGYDNGRGVDSGRELGSWQSEELKSHSHGYTRAWSGNNNAMWHPNTTAGIATGSDNLTEGGNAILDTGGSETRPRNVTLLPCIKY
ncbi:hypothetical protein D7D81_16835 [Halocella sp. SP3-1]|nr:hypothetical protein D7D81_16835 [Halocella sp. SP3-1]